MVIPGRAVSEKEFSAQLQCLLDDLQMENPSFHDYRLSLSVGGVTCTAPVEDATHVIRQVDERLYENKGMWHDIARDA